MVDYVGESCGNVRLPGIMMLGYVAAHSENLAMAVIVSKVGKIKAYSDHILVTTQFVYTSMTYINDKHEIFSSLTALQCWLLSFISLYLFSF